MSRIGHHRSHRSNWLRASVLGANDGIVSTASLIIGVSMADASHVSILLAGLAGMVAGAMSMAAGEYVSVSSQADIERADLEMERKSLEHDYEFELQELADIYVERGVEPDLASQVARQMMEHDALGAHARDEIGIVDTGRANPIQAAMASASAFTLGAFLPLAIAWTAPLDRLAIFVAFTSLIFLATLGGIAARAGGASIPRAAFRVCFWSALAMVLTACVGWLFGVSV